MGQSESDTRHHGVSAWGGLPIAAGWLICAGLAGSMFAPAEAALLLCTMAAAECLGRLLVLGWAGQGTKEQALPNQWGQALGAVLLRWLLFVSALGLLLAADALPFLRGKPLAALCLAGSALLLSLMHLAVALRRARGAATWPFAARLLLAAAVIWALEQLSRPSSEILLATLFLLWLLMALALLRGAPAPFATDPSSNPGPQGATLGPALLRYGDMLIVLCLLPPGPALGYILLRGAGLALSMALQPLLIAAEERLSAGAPGAFAPAAARLNLGLLLIGGGLGLAILTLYELIPAQMSLLRGAGPEVLAWHLLAAAAPALFGAGPLFMTLTGMRREWGVLSLGAALLMGSLAYGLTLSTPLAFAQLHAGAQLTSHVLAAWIIGRRHGVWPGPTALLFRHIRLL